MSVIIDGKVTHIESEEAHLAHYVERMAEVRAERDKEAARWKRRFDLAASHIQAMMDADLAIAGDTHPASVEMREWYTQRASALLSALWIVKGAKVGSYDDGRELPNAR